MTFISQIRARGRQVSLLIVLAIMGVSVAVLMDGLGTSAEAIQAVPQVAVSPGAGPAGSGLRIDGSGFAAYKRGDLRWQRGTTTVSYQRVTTDARGAFSLPATAPPVSGLYTVSYASRGVTAAAWFSVAADGETIPPATPTADSAVSTPTPVLSPTLTSTPAATSAQSATPAPTSPTGRNVVGYFPIWARNAGYGPSDIDFTAVNTVAHFAVVPRTDGSIEIPDWGPFPDTELLSVAHREGARVVLVVGGDHYAATNGFSSMAATASTRAAFIKQLTNLVATYGYDGVDLDWEFPNSFSDRVNLTALVTELRAALPTGKTLSMAAPASDWYGRYIDVASVVPHLDWIGSMTYTFAASSWSPTASHNSALYGANSLESSKDYYLGRGVPRAKLLLGIPFYGERFDGAEQLGDTLSNNLGGAVHYPEILGLASNGWTYNRDAVAGVPYLLRNDGSGVLTYDDAWSIGLKCDYVRSESLGGAIVWSLGQDRTSGSQPLLTAVRGCR